MCHSSWVVEDCTNAFKGKGKVDPLNKLKNPRFHKAVGIVHLPDRVASLQWTSSVPNY